MRKRRASRLRFGTCARRSQYLHSIPFPRPSACCVTVPQAKTNLSIAELGFVALAQQEAQQFFRAEVPTQLRDWCRARFGKCDTQAVVVQDPDEILR